MTMNRREFTASLAATATGILSAPAVLAQPKIEMKLAYFVGDQHAMSQWLIRWANNLEKDSGGRIAVKRFPGSQMGPVQQHYDFARTGPLPGADVLVMGRVLHNWDLATKKLLLTKAYATLPVDGVLIVYERLIDDDRSTNAAALLGSLNMLIMTTGGFDYSGADCTQWLLDVGFRDVRVEALTADQTSLIARK